MFVKGKIYERTNYVERTDEELSKFIMFLTKPFIHVSVLNLDRVDEETSVSPTVEISTHPVYCVLLPSFVFNKISKADTTEPVYKDKSPCDVIHVTTVIDL